jgi:flagellar protein FliS
MSMNGANQYKQMAVKTANPGQILIMLYEAAIRNIKKAMNCIDQKDIAGKGQAIVKAHDIVNELMNTLNFEVGGQVARDLERLYGYMSEQLLKANLNNSKEPLEGVLKNMETLLEGWKVAVLEFQKAQAKGMSPADIKSQPQTATNSASNGATANSATAPSAQNNAATKSTAVSPGIQKPGMNKGI